MEVETDRKHPESAPVFLPTGVREHARLMAETERTNGQEELSRDLSVLDCGCAVGFGFCRNVFALMSLGRLLKVSDRLQAKR